VDIRAAILAGGRATRMGGRSKALVEVGGRAILDRQLEVLRPRFAAGAMAAVLAADAGPADAAPFAARQLVLLRDVAGGQGPLAGLAAALAWAGESWLLAVACDMPLMEPRVVETILARASRADIAVPRAGGRVQPLLAGYSPRCAALVARRLADGARKMSDLPDAARAAGLVVDEIDEREIRNLDPDLRTFANINRESDLAELAELAALAELAERSRG
jgi:molybdopterin-guanine dinucleotide biosynthesis protein A